MPTLVVNMFVCCPLLTFEHCYDIKFQFVPAKHKNHVYLKDDLNFLYRVRYKKKHGNGEDFKKV